MTYFLYAHLPNGGRIDIKHPRSLNQTLAVNRAISLVKKRKCICEVVEQGKGQATVVWSNGIVDINPNIN